MEITDDLSLSLSQEDPKMFHWPIISVGINLSSIEDYGKTPIDSSGFRICPLMQEISIRD